MADSKTKDAMEQLNKRRIEMNDGFKLLDVCLSQQEQGMDRWIDMDPILAGRMSLSRSDGR